MFTAIGLGSAAGAVEAVVDGLQHRVGHRAALLLEIILSYLPDDHTAETVVFNPLTLTVENEIAK